MQEENRLQQDEIKECKKSVREANKSKVQLRERAARRLTELREEKVRVKELQDDLA